MVAASGGHVVSGWGTAAGGWPAKVRARRSVRPQRFARELPRSARAGRARRRVPGRAERNRARHRRDRDRARRPDRAAVRPRGRVRGCARRLDPVRPRQSRRTGPASEDVLERERARASGRRRAPRPRAHLAADCLRFPARRAHGRDVRRPARSACRRAASTASSSRARFCGRWFTHCSGSWAGRCSRKTGARSRCRSAWPWPSGSSPRRSTVSDAGRCAARSRSPPRGCRCRARAREARLAGEPCDGDVGLAGGALDVQGGGAVAGVAARGGESSTGSPHTARSAGRGGTAARRCWRSRCTRAALHAAVTAMQRRLSPAGLGHRNWGWPLPPWAARSRSQMRPSCCSCRLPRGSISTSRMVSK
jgi:hypothetical protein